MLEHYFTKPDTVDRIRACWLGDAIEKHVIWIAEQGYGARLVHRRVPLLRQFAEFSWEAGARFEVALPAHIEPFVAHWLAKGSAKRSVNRLREMGNEIRGPVEHFLSQLLPDFVRRGRQPWGAPDPFAAAAPGFFSYLREERGLRETSVQQYRHFLLRLEDYLARIGLDSLAELSSSVLSAFITESSRQRSPNTITGCCSSVRVFVRYLHREGLVVRDLAPTIGTPQKYRLSDVPRSISWEEVQRMLDAVDRRTATGKRDYVILLLLVTYGLRAREVAALTLDDIDWERDRLLVSERKAGHCTAYPLSIVVGEALTVYLKEVRPAVTERAIFLRVLAPYVPLTYNTVSNRATHYLRKADIHVRRPGSHTLRHTCVQRLIDAEFPLKTVGDYVGHGSPRSTEIYSKVAVETLRMVALGDGEALL